MDGGLLIIAVKWCLNLVATLKKYIMRLVATKVEYPVPSNGRGN